MKKEEFIRPEETSILDDMIEIKSLSDEILEDNSNSGQKQSEGNGE